MVLKKITTISQCIKAAIQTGYGIERIVAVTCGGEGVWRRVARESNEICDKER